jgi:hypothetical protein
MPDGLCKDSWFRRPLSQPTWGTVALLHANCLCTESAALLTRVFVDTPQLTDRGRGVLSLVVGIMCKQLQPMSVEPWSISQVVGCYSGKKRALYERAEQSFELDPISSRDARVAMFVKADKLTFKEGYPTRPRAIQGRSPRFNLWFGQFVKPAEESFYRWRGPRRGVSRSRMVAKGLDGWDRATLLQAKLKEFDEPVVICLDANAFDSCNKKFHLTLLHRVYRVLIRDPEFAWGLQQQLSNSGVSQHGIKYRVDGNRMSGDMDTAFGNCVLSIALTYAIMRILGISKWDALVDGDDQVVIIERAAAGAIADIRSAVKAAFLELGFRMDVAVLGLQDELRLEDIEFCRGRFCELQTGRWCLVRDVRRALATFGVTHLIGPEQEDQYWEFLHGAALCELAVSRHVPCIGPLAGCVSSILRDTACRFEGELWVHGHKLDESRVRGLVGGADVSPEARVSIERAFNISIDEQLAYEASIPSRVAAMLSNSWEVKEDGIAEYGANVFLGPEFDECLDVDS